MDRPPLPRRHLLGVGAALLTTLAGCGGGGGGGGGVPLFPIVPAPPPPDPESLKVPVAAYVDLETRLPSMLVAGDDTSTFAFGPAPTAPLDPPKEVKDVTEKFMQRAKRLLTRPAKP